MLGDLGPFPVFEGVRVLTGIGGVAVATRSEGDWCVNRACVAGELPPLSRMDCGGGVRELVGIGGLGGIL